MRWSFRLITTGPKRSCSVRFGMYLEAMEALFHYLEDNRREGGTGYSYTPRYIRYFMTIPELFRSCYKQGLLWRWERFFVLDTKSCRDWWLARNLILLSDLSQESISRLSIVGLRPEKAIRRTFNGWRGTSGYSKIRWSTLDIRLISMKRNLSRA